MKGHSIMDRIEMILTKEELKRIKKEKRCISVNIIGMSVKTAKRLINNLIALSSTEMETTSFKIIYDISCESEQKQMVMNEIKNPRIISRNSMTEYPGVTYIGLAV